MNLVPVCSIECVLAWLVYGDGAKCLLCGGNVYWREERE